MTSKIQRSLLVSITIIALFFTSVIPSYAGAINYVYDDLNRVTRIAYDDGKIVEYTYDEVGNRQQKTISLADTTAPTTTSSPSGGIYGAAQTVTLTCSDGSGAGCNNIYYTIDGTTPTTASTVYSAPISITATKTLKYFAKDLVGNAEAVKTQTYTIDTTAPTGTITVNAGATATNSVNVTLTLTCSDAHSCSQMKFSNDNVTYLTAETAAATKAWTLTAGDATKTVYVKFKDTVGNWSTAYSDTIILDSTVPDTTTAPSGGAYNTAQSVTLTCNAGSGSLCDKIYYTTDGTTPTTASTVYSAPISISTTKTLKYFARDLAGNSEAVKTQTYIIDTTAPTGTINVNAGATTTNNVNVTLTLACSDAQGCSQMKFSNDNVTYSTAEAYSTTKAWTLTAGDGTKTVYVKLKDSAGNWSIVYSDTISLISSMSDLTMTAVSGTTSANITEPITVSFTVKNQGGGSVGAFNVGIYLSTDASITVNDTLIGYAPVTSLAAGAQTVLTGTLRIPANITAGTYYIGAIADYANAVAESNETNNTAAGNQIAITAVSPDLTVTAVSGPTSANITQPAAVSVTVKNQGGTTGAFNVGIYLSTDATITTGDTLLGYVTISSLGAGAQVILGPTLRIPTTVTAGTYYLGAIADNTGVITESSETNNALAGNQIAITAVSPDLTVTAVSGPTSGNITQPIAVAMTIKDQGGATGGFYVSLYLSTDSTVTTGDTYLGSSYVTAIGAGVAGTINMTVRIPSNMPTGTYYIGAIVDDGNNVLESSESNNTLVGNMIAITATLPDLTVTAVSGPATGTKGQPITISSTVKNQGGTTGSFYVGIYLSTDATITTGDINIGYASIGTLTAGTETSISGPITIPTSLASGTYYMGAIADTENYIAESNEANNTKAGNQITIAP